MSVHVSSGNYLSRTGGIPASHQNFAACGWFKRKSDTAASEYWLHFGSGTAPIQVRIGDDDTLRLNLQYSGSRVVNAGAVAVGVWIFIGVICSGTTATLVWRSEEDVGLSSGTANNTGGDWTSDLLYVGRDAGSGVSDALVAYLRVWNASKTINELLAESLSPVAVSVTDLLSDHAMTGANIAAAVEDDSAANNDFTATGSPTVDADMPDLGTASSAGFPDADIDAGTWTPSSGSDLYAMIDEAVADDDDYIESVSSGTCRISIAPMTAPPVGGSSTWRYRIDGTVTVVLHDGTSAIFTEEHVEVASPTTFTRVLTAGEKSAVANWGTLEWRFTRP